MIILPAIDMLQGKPVRLVRGDYGQSSQVAEDVIDTARSFEKQNAAWIHMVDLDGAKAGHPVNLDLALQAAAAVDIPVELGGGFRSIEHIEKAIEGGIARVILGTSALNDEALLRQALDKYKERIAVGMDCRNGKVSVAGWLQDSDMDYLDFARKMEDLGVQTLIVTDISKDGTLEGPALQMMKNLKNHVSINLIASGGIRDLGNIKDLKEAGCYGAITGKAIYAGTLDLQQAIQEAQNTQEEAAC